MPTAEESPRIQALKEHSGWAIAIGIILIILGIFALGSPLVTGVAVAIMVGSFLLVGGIVQFVFAFRATGTRYDDLVPVASFRCLGRRYPRWYRYSLHWLVHPGNWACSPKTVTINKNILQNKAVRFCPIVVSRLGKGDFLSVLCVSAVRWPNLYLR